MQAVLFWNATARGNGWNFGSSSHYNPRMAVIGITGGIASGKSTFTRLIGERISAEIFDADAEARRFLESDEEVRREVLRDIGARAYRENGSPDRAAIRAIIFTNWDAKARLEAILHPRVRAKWLLLVSKQTDPARHLLVDIPLLFETGAEFFCDRVVTVVCSEKKQFERLGKRGLAQEEAQKIISSQIPSAEKIARSSHVVWNDGSLVSLAMQARELAECLALP